MLLLQSLVLPSLLVASHMATTGTVMAQPQQLSRVHQQQQQARPKQAPPLPRLLLQSLVLPSLLAVSRMVTTGTAMDRPRRLVHLRALPQVPLRVPELMKAVLAQSECKFPCLLSLIHI